MRTKRLLRWQVVERPVASWRLVRQIPRSVARRLTPARSQARASSSRPAWYMTLNNSVAIGGSFTARVEGETIDFNRGGSSLVGILGSGNTIELAGLTPCS